MAFPAGWKYKWVCTVPTTSVPSLQTDFPVTIDLSDAPAEFFTHVRSDGGDIRCYLPNETTEIPRHVVSIDTGAGTGEIKVKRTLSSAVDTDIVVIYGNAAATEPAASSTYGSQNSYKSAVKAILPLNETSPAAGISDASANAHHIDLVFGATSVSGLFGNAVHVDGVTQHFDWTGTTPIAGETAITLEILFKSSDTAGLNRLVSGGVNDYLEYLIDAQGATSSLYIRFQLTTVPNTGNLNPAGSWNYAAIRLTPTDMRVNTNGSQTFDNPTNWSNTVTTPVRFGARWNGSTVCEATIEEIAVYSGDEGSDYCNTRSNNLLSPATFYSIGAEVAIGGGARVMNMFNGGFNEKLGGMV